MDWIFENIGKFLPIIIAILYMIGSARSRNVEEEEEVDPEAAERARKIQEEIRRKILERQQGARPNEVERPREVPVQTREVAAPPTLHEKPERGDQWHEKAERRVREVVEVPEAMKEEEWGGFSHPASIYERQQEEIQEKLQKARELREKISKKPLPSSPIFAPKRSWEAAFTSSNLRSLIQSDLRDRASIRKAIVLKEILDTPVGLR